MAHFDNTSRQRLPNEILLWIISDAFIAAFDEEMRQLHSNALLITQLGKQMHKLSLVSIGCLRQMSSTVKSLSAEAVANHRAITAALCAMDNQEATNEVIGLSAAELRERQRQRLTLCGQYWLAGKMMRVSLRLVHGSGPTMRRLMSGRTELRSEERKRKREAYRKDSDGDAVMMGQGQ